MHNYCTIFSRESLYRGLLFYYSLQKYDEDFMLFIIFLQDDVRKLVERMNLKNTVLISSQEIEEGDRELLNIKESRSDQEYAWTLKAPALLYIFRNYPWTGHIVYMDGDIEFYSSSQPLFEELANYTVLLTRERFYIQDNEEWYKKYGRFNGGMLAVKREAVNILEWLRNRCIGWCHNKVENGLYGDQIYIDEMQKNFEGIGVSKNMGLNATAWYSHASVVERQSSRLYVNDLPIVFYHYSGLRQYINNEFELCIYVNLPSDLINLIYVPYLKRLNAMREYVAQFDSGFYGNTITKNESGYYKNFYKLESNETSNQGEIQSKASRQVVLEHRPKAMNFCTIIGKDYVIKGLALYQSLKKYASDFQLYICVIDSTAESILRSMKLDNASIIPLEQIEDRELLGVKGKRTTSEYCWTLKSSWMLYLLENYPDIKSIAFIDSDIFFFSSPDCVFDELNDNSILLCPQRDTHEVEVQFGKYQAGFIGVKRDKNALSFLTWWRKKCLEWCSSEQGHADKWGDQKYLDWVPNIFWGVKVSENWGIDAAIWNTKNNLTVEQELKVNRHRLVAYHFCCVEIFNEEDFNLWTWPNWRVDESLKEYIYLPYIKSLRSSMEKIREAGFDIISLWVNNERKSSAVNYYRYVHRE
jgi:hypothetical protein